MTRSAHSAIEDLKLQRLYVIHAGDHSFALAKGVRAIAMARLFDDSEPRVYWEALVESLPPPRPSPASQGRERYGPFLGLRARHAAKDLATNKGWIVISMKNDWKRVFAFET